MSNDLELDNGTFEEIKSRCAVGDKFAREKKYDAALNEYKKAWDLIPLPKNEWGAATWVLAAIADSAFLAGYKISAREALEYAMTCPDAIGNPFLHMRLGQVLFDAGELDGAAEQLIRAYMGAGAKVFSNEDPKYLEFLGTRARL